MYGSGSVALTRAAGLGSLPALIEEHAGTARLFQMLEQEGLPADVLQQPDTPVPAHAVMSMFQRAGRLLGDRTLGLEVGRLMTHRGFGLWVEHSILAPTLGAAVRRGAATLWAHQTQSRVEIVDCGRHVLWRYVPPPLDARNSHHTDHIIVPMLDLARLYLGKGWLPDWIEVDYPRDPDAAILENRLEVPLHFGCPGLAVALRKADLARRRIIAAPAGQRMVTLREVTADVLLTDAPEPARSLSAIVALRLMDGQSDIEGAARMAGLGVQGLQRRLREKGFTYREIIEAACHKRAVRLLCESDASVVDIAFSLGYSEHAAFSRAFRRWAGCTPSEFRTRGRAATQNAKPAMAVAD